ncbi:GNAT family N-acetyltransferase [Actinomycetospora termitidis]|uniref:GNAT family N-acetyltransferase n=1 Tax=Actinomycetospora termitidis TaxID=3053470 RepID=A0ABT7MB46_9PSEU|nr:GNAT family N-acetyltransferase [Actinomycetospora sp. Odt1-22]MDL5157890.1 GNAT family N-acetyltransferase [Actinomycetospora sp. Odt1-22]
MTTLLGLLTRLRAWRDDDAEAIFRACQDADVQRFTTVPSPYRREDADWFLAHHVHDVEGEGGASFCLEGLEAPGRVAGSMALLHVRDGVGEIGYWTAAEARGRGWTADGLATLAAWTFAERECRRLELVIERANEASTGVARRVGFRADREEPARVLRDGSVRDVVVHVLEA